MISPPVASFVGGWRAAAITICTTICTSQPYSKDRWLSNCQNSTSSDVVQKLLRKRRPKHTPHHQFLKKKDFTKYTYSIASTFRVLSCNL